MRRILVWLVLSSSLLACSSSMMGTSSADSAEIDEMKRRILELQKKAAVAEVEIERLRQKVADLEAGLPGDVAAPQTRPADPVPRAVPPTAAPAPDEPVAREPIEESDLTVESVPVAPPPTDRVAEQPTPEAEPSISPPSPTGAGAAMQPVSPAAQAIYDQGYTLFHQGRYLDAESSFQRFLQANPQTDLSDNAQYWIGESRSSRGDLRGALAAFRETRQRYPQGNKVPDALVKEGDCQKGLGDLDGARDSYEEVMRRFPDTAAALIAEERLAGVS